jgi:glycosyltransferase involved in cell wall biosynthesis
VFDLAGLDRERRLRTVALEVLASPTPVVYTNLIRVRDLEVLWRCGVRTIPVIHNSRPGWHDAPDRYDVPQVPFVVAVCESVAEQLRASGCRTPVVVIRHEVQRWPAAGSTDEARSQVRRQHGIDDRTLLVGMVGQFKAHKAYTRAVRVLRELARTRRTKLIILGGWDHAYGAGRTTYAATCRLALDLGVMPDLLLPGAIQPPDPYYAAFDVFLNTSVYEGLSIATLEALQHGCRVVTARVGGQGEICSPLIRYVDDVASPEAYVRAIDEVLGERPSSRTPPPVPPQPDLVPRLWALLAEHGVSAGAALRARSGTLFVTSNLNPGGAQRSLANLLSALPSSSRPYLCVMSAVLGTGYLSQIEGRGVPVIALDYRASILERVEHLLELARRLNVATVCFWNADSRVKLLVAKILQAAPLRVVDVSPGPMLFEELDAEAAFQHRIAFDTGDYLRRLDALVVKYEAGRPAARYGVRPSRVVVIRNGVAMPPARFERPCAIAPPADADPRFAIVATCRIAPNKRIDLLVDMMVALADRAPRATLTIVGGVDQRHLGYWTGIRERIDRAGLRSIQFAGPHADVFQFLPRFRVAAVTGRAQGCPNASLEAMAAGLPVVAFSDGGTDEQIVDGVNGFHVRVDSGEAMADRVAELLHDPVRAAAMGRRGAQIVRDGFSMDAMVSAYARVLEPGHSHEQSFEAVS